MLDNILNLKGVSRLKKQHLQKVYGGSCMQLCTSRGSWFISQGWTQQEAHTYVSGCIISCEEP